MSGFKRVQPIGHTGVPMPRKRGRPSKAELAARAAQQATVAVVHETDEEIVARIEDRFHVFNELTHGIANGDIPALIASGAPGIGKTFTAERILEKAEQDGRIVVIKRGVMTPINLYKLLYQNRTSKHIIMLDDLDSIFMDLDSLSLLKAALDTNAVRRLAWMSQSAALKSEEIESEFIFEGSMMFITNIDFQSYLDNAAVNSKLGPHLAALISRSLYLDLTLHRPAELMAWVQHATRKHKIGVQNGISLTQTEEMLVWMKKNRDRLREISLRTVVKAATFMKASPKGWYAFAESTLCRN